MAVYDDRAKAGTNWCFNMRLHVIGLDCNNNMILHDNAYTANT